MNKIEAGRCGCGVPETDTDGDSVPDCIDDYPTDPDNGAGGGGQAPIQPDDDGNDSEVKEDDACFIGVIGN